MSLISILLSNKKKIFLLLLFLFLFWIWKDYKKIDLHFVNQSKVTYNKKNLNSNALKKLDALFNEKIENFLVTYSDIHKAYWNVTEKDERYKLPEYKIIKNINKNKLEIDLLKKLLTKFSLNFNKLINNSIERFYFKIRP